MVYFALKIWPMIEKAKQTVKILFKHLGELIPVNTFVGHNVLRAAHENGIPLEGACEANLACSTCHVILEKTVFNPADISDRENDLLDLAYGLRPTSRLGCQVIIDKKMENKVFELPRCTRNLAVDGYKPPVH